MCNQQVIIKVYYENMKQFDFYTIDSVTSIMKREENCGRLNYSSFSQEVKGISADLKKKRQSLRTVSKDKRIELYEEIKILKQQYDEQKEIELRELTDQIAKGKYPIQIDRKEIDGKQVYTTADNQSLIISKIISRELAHHYRVKPSNRNTIIEQLIAIVDNPMPKIVIRADVHHFYESIPLGPIMNKLMDDSYLSKRTIKYLKSFIFKCGLSKEDSVGVPRGLSFSAYLAEIYMGSIDRIIRQIQGVYFYKRYVDDIIIVANPQIMNVTDYWNSLTDSFRNKQLELHNDSNKYFVSLFDKDSENESFEYLGYKFSYNKGRLQVLLSNHRYNKYCTIIKALFDIYSKCASARKYKRTKNTSDKRPDALFQLIERIKVLTGNGLLSGRKNYIPTGVYYSNRFLTDTSQLKQLDNLLYEIIENEKCFSPPKTLFNYSLTNGYESNIKIIKEKLHEFSFVESFKNPLIHKSQRYSQVQRTIQKIYCKYEQVSTNIQI